jgi:hypothetical protein
MFVTQLVHLLFLFLALLEASEIILNEERGIELANGHLIVRCTCKFIHMIVSD